MPKVTLSDFIICLHACNGTQSTSQQIDQFVSIINRSLIIHTRTEQHLCYWVTLETFRAFFRQSLFHVTHSFITFISVAGGRGKLIQMLVSPRSVSRCLLMFHRPPSHSKGSFYLEPVRVTRQWSFTSCAEVIYALLIDKVAKRKREGECDPVSKSDRVQDAF